MKPLIYFFIATIFVASVAAQNDDPDWELIKKANAKSVDAFKKYKKYELAGHCSKTDFEELMTMYNEAIDILKPLEGGKYSKQVKFVLCENYLMEGLSSFKLNPDSLKRDKQAAKYMDYTFEKRPTLNSISFEDVKSVTNQAYFKASFLDQVYFSYSIYWNNGEYAKSVKNGWEYIMLMKGNYGDGFVNKIVEGKSNKDTTISLDYDRLNYILGLLPEDLSKNNRKEDALKTYIDKLEFEMKKENFKIKDKDDLNPFAILTSKTPKEKYHKIFDSICLYVVKPGGYDATGEQTKKAIADFQKAEMLNEALILTRVIADKPSPTNDFLWTYAELAYKTAVKGEATPYVDAKAELRNALSLLEKNSTYFYSSDWEKMKTYYAYLGDTESVARIEKLQKAKLKKEKKASFKSNIGIGIATNPVYIAMTGTRQVPIALDIHLKKVIHTFRYNMMTDVEDQMHFGNLKGSQVNADGNSATKEPNTYSGYEFSYTLKLRPKKQVYFGPEFRYANYDFAPISTTVKNNTTNTISTESVGPKVNRYDLTINWGVRGGKKIFYYDAYYGLGIGYKTYDFGKYNLKDYTFNDYRYSPKNLKSLYVPFRMGFRVGFYIL